MISSIWSSTSVVWVTMRSPRFSMYFALPPPLKSIPNSSRNFRASISLLTEVAPLSPVNPPEEPRLALAPPVSVRSTTVLKRVGFTV